MDNNFKLPERRFFARIRFYWKPVAIHEQFEKIIAMVLSIAIAVIIVISLIQVIRTIVTMLLTNALNPLDHTVFQAVFGMHFPWNSIVPVFFHFFSRHSDHDHSIDEYSGKQYQSFHPADCLV